MYSCPQRAAKEQGQDIKQTSEATKCDVELMNRVVQLVLSNGEGMEAGAGVKKPKKLPKMQTPEEEVRSKWAQTESSRLKMIEFTAEFLPTAKVPASEEKRGQANQS